jgi:hypothetical protein
MPVAFLASSRTTGTNTTTRLARGDRKQPLRLANGPTLRDAHRQSRSDSKSCRIAPARIGVFGPAGQLSSFLSVTDNSRLRTLDRSGTSVRLANGGVGTLRVQLSRCVRCGSGSRCVRHRLRSRTRRLDAAGQLRGHAQRSPWGGNRLACKKVIHVMDHAVRVTT